MNKRIFCSALLICSLFISLCACGKESNTSEAQDKKTNGKQVTISYCLWGGLDRQAYTEETIAVFEELHPDINVEVEFIEKGSSQTYMDVKMSCGTEADLMQINYSWIRRYSPDGTGFYNLDELGDIISLENYDFNDYKYGTSNGRLNAIPVAMTTSLPIYNTYLYEKYHLAIPKTWDDLFVAASRMKKDHIYPIIMSDEELTSWMLTYYRQLTGKSLDTDYLEESLDEKAFKKVADMFTRLIEEKVICPPGQFTEDMLEMGRAAGVMCGISSIERVSDRIKKQGGKVGLGDFISVENPIRFGYFLEPAYMLAISKNTKHPQEVATLLEYLSNSKENALIQGVDKGVPSSKAAEMYLMQDGSLDSVAYRAKVLMDYKNDELTVRPAVLDKTNYVQGFINTMNKYRRGASLKSTIETVCKLNLEK